MRTREQKSEYDVRFIRERCVKKTVLLNREQDAEIIEYLKGVPNFNAYIKELIRKELETMEGKRYKIKPEYLDLWGSEANEDSVVTESDIERLAVDWDMTPEQIREQLEEI